MGSWSGIKLTSASVIFSQGKNPRKKTDISKSRTSINSAEIKFSLEKINKVGPNPKS
jgi:glutamyl-tRNA reductase